MVSVLLLTAFAVAEAVVAVVLMAHLSRRREQSQMCDGLDHWRV